MKLFDLMEALIDANDRCDWNLSTGRHTPRRDMMKAVKAGLAESAGMCVEVDGDGWTKEPERYREAFKITPLGRKWLKVARANLLEGGYPRFTDQQILTFAKAEA